MEIVSVPFIVVICYLLGQLYKFIFKKRPDLYKLIPVILPIVGGVLGIVIYLTTPEEIFDVSNFWQAMFIGIISGASSTGANQILKQLFKNESDEK